MDAKEILKLFMENKVVMGTFINKERALELTNAFMRDPELKEVFVETEIRLYGTPEQNTNSSRNESES